LSPIPTSNNRWWFGQRQRMLSTVSGPRLRRQGLPAQRIRTWKTSDGAYGRILPTIDSQPRFPHLLIGPETWPLPTRRAAWMMMCKNELINWRYVDAALPPPGIPISSSASLKSWPCSKRGLNFALNWEVVYAVAGVACAVQRDVRDRAASGQQRRGGENASDGRREGDQNRAGHALICQLGGAAAAVAASPSGRAATNVSSATRP
jgi:hypothetical protein